MLHRRAVRALLLGAAVALSAQGVFAGIVVQKRPSEKVTAELSGALAHLDRNAGGPRSSVHGHSALRSKGIIIVGGKTDLPGQGSPAATSIIVIYTRPSLQTSLRRLQGAVRKFEREAGADSPGVALCKRREGECLQQCRAALRQLRVKGSCSCIGVRAHCLDKAYRLNRSSGKVRFGDGERGRRPPSGK
jgi:hypothetical protein